MASGRTAGDTYALFKMGGGMGSGQHLDASQFVIYKKGFLVIDSRARHGSDKHHAGYWSQTIGHNCVLIGMPGEVLPEAPRNAGGQRNPPQSAKPVAFRTSRDFCYAATDVTATYHQDKCSQMVRQVVFLPPNHFVVFDRVTATKPDYPKTWLLHTSNEPALTGKTFDADQGQGRVFCRTLLPEDAVLEKVGGPGREFWVDGENLGVPDDWQYWNMVPGHVKGTIPETMGRWRMEVKPGSPRAEDVFLHLIQVGDQKLEQMSEAKVTTASAKAEVTFSAGDRAVTLSFAAAGDIAGHIRIVSGHQALVDRDLAREVMPQKGLATE
jgi:heparin/heparan-sulfate lyase